MRFGLLDVLESGRTEMPALVVEDVQHPELALDEVEDGAQLADVGDVTPCRDRPACRLLDGGDNSFGGARRIPRPTTVAPSDANGSAPARPICREPPAVDECPRGR